MIFFSKLFSLYFRRFTCDGTSSGVSYERQKVLLIIIEMLRNISTQLTRVNPTKNIFNRKKCNIIAKYSHMISVITIISRYLNFLLFFNISIIFGVLLELSYVLLYMFLIRNLSPYIYLRFLRFLHIAIISDYTLPTFTVVYRRFYVRVSFVLILNKIGCRDNKLDVLMELDRWNLGLKYMQLNRCFSYEILSAHIAIYFPNVFAVPDDVHQIVYHLDKR